MASATNVGYFAQWPWRGRHALGGIDMLGEQPPAGIREMRKTVKSSPHAFSIQWDPQEPFWLVEPDLFRDHIFANNVLGYLPPPLLSVRRGSRFPEVTRAGKRSKIVNVFGQRDRPTARREGFTPPTAPSRARPPATDSAFSPREMARRSSPLDQLTPLFKPSTLPCTWWPHTATTGMGPSERRRSLSVVRAVMSHLTSAIMGPPDSLACPPPTFRPGPSTTGLGRSSAKPEFRSRESPEKPPVDWGLTGAEEARVLR